MHTKCPEKGWMSNDLVMYWVKHVWERLPGMILQNLCIVLVMDSYGGQLTNDTKGKLQQLNCVQVIIPGGMTSMLWPLDMCINCPFKAHMKQMYGGRVDGYCRT